MEAILYCTLPSCWFFTLNPYLTFLLFDFFHYIIRVNHLNYVQCRPPPEVFFILYSKYLQKLHDFPQHLRANGLWKKYQNLVILSLRTFLGQPVQKWFCTGCSLMLCVCRGIVWYHIQYGLGYTHVLWFWK